MHFKIAWRNIWRNPRRTGVIMLAIVIGVWSMIFLGAFMRGMLVAMIDNGISTLTGHLQVHQKDYPDDPVVDYSFLPEPVEETLTRKMPAGSLWTSRVKVNAVCSNARHSGGISLVGIEPEREAVVSFIGKAVQEGRYLKADESGGILIGRALAEKYETKLGRKLILMSQDTNGEIASRAFRIVGIFRAELEATEKQFVFVGKEAAQRMLGLGEHVSEIAVLLPDDALSKQKSVELKAALSSAEYSVMSWYELQPFLNSYIEIFDGFTYIWFLVVFVAMGFGIVNSTLMAVYERMREFGLLKALGQRPGLIITGVMVETCFILLVGIGIGNILGFASVFAMAGGGIDLSAMAAGAEYAGMPRVIFPVLSAQDVTVANLVVFVLGLVVSIYPAVRAARFTPVEAMMHN